MDRKRVLLYSLLVVVALFAVWMFMVQGGSKHKTSRKPVVAQAPVQAPAPITEVATTPKEETPEDMAKDQKTNRYFIKSKDTLWGISWANYKNSYLWPIIFVTNGGVVKDPDLILAGTYLNIPFVQNTERLNTLENYQLALGNLYTYFRYKQAGRKDAVYFLWVAKQRDPGVVEKHASDIPAADLAFIEKIHVRVR